MCEVRDGLPGLQRDLLRYALTLTRNAVDAADLVQDTCVRALSSPEQFATGTSLQRWCFGIMRNLHIDNWRNRARRGAHLDQVAATAYEAVDGGQEAAVLLRQVLDAASRCRTFFVAEMAMDAAGGTIKEIADRMGGVPEGTIKNRLSRSRAALREALQWDERARPGPAVKRRRRADNAARDVEIVAAYEARQSISDIARRHQLSRLRIRQIVAAQAAEAAAA